MGKSSLYLVLFGVLFGMAMTVSSAFADSAEERVFISVREANRNPDSLAHQFTALRRVYPIVRSGSSALDTSILRSFFNLAVRARKIAPKDAEAKYWFAVALGETAMRRTEKDKRRFLKAYQSVIDSCLRTTGGDLRLQAQIHLAGIRSRALDDSNSAIDALRRLLLQIPQDAPVRNAALFELHAALTAVGNMDEATELLAEEGASSELGSAEFLRRYAATQ